MKKLLKIRQLMSSMANRKERLCAQARMDSIFPLKIMWEATQ